jgi:hypothetical protein
MAGMNLEALGPIYTPAGQPMPFHTSFHPSHSLSSAPLRELRDLRRTTARNTSPSVMFHWRSLPQRESHFVAGIDLHPATIMNPGSPSRHSSDVRKKILDYNNQLSHPILLWRIPIVGILDTGVSRSTCSWAPSMAQLRPRGRPMTEA